MQNRAIGGRSSRTFITEGRWEKVLAEMQPADFVMMQFGHNDGGPLDDAARSRGSLKGTGDETREIENPILKRHETVHTYGWYMRKYIADTRAKQCTPLVCSPVPRKIWKNGKIARDDRYAGWAREIATSANVPFIDLATVIANHYDVLDRERVDPLFADEHTHTTRAGAELNAMCVMEALRALSPNLLQPYLATSTAKA